MRHLEMIMKNNPLIRYSNLYLIIIFIFYTLALIFNIRGGYLSGDEIGFLSSFSDRDAEESFDLRYFIWTAYIFNTAKIHPILPQLTNLILACVLISISIKHRLVKPCLALLVLLLPTVFYFFNGYLRDVFFFISSFFLIVLVGKEYRIRPRIFVYIFFLWILVLSMRPFYGIIYLVAFMLSQQRFTKHFRLIFMSIIAAFIMGALLIYIYPEVYNQYFDFFYYGHNRGKEHIGTLMIPVEDFTQTTAAMNFLFSPVYFWFLPVEGFGSTYDVLIPLENSLIFIVFLFAIFSLIFRRLYSDRTFRMAWIVIALSLFMAAATTVHGDAYRFRLIFLPFLFYLASCVRFNPVKGTISAFLRVHFRRYHGESSLK